VPAPPRRHLPHEGIFPGVEFLPPVCDGLQEGRPVGDVRVAAGVRGVLAADAQDVVQQRGRGVERCPLGDAEGLESSADALEDLE